MRTTLLGSLLDVAQGNLARDAERVALFESGRVYLPGEGRTWQIGPAGRRLPRRAAGARREPHRLGCLAVGPLARQVMARRWRAGGLLRAQGRARRPGRPARRRACLRVQPRSRSCIPAARLGSSSAASPLAGSASCTRLVCRAWDLEAAVGFEVDLAALIAAAPAGEEAFEDVTTFPAVYQDLAVVVPAAVPAAELREAVLARRRRAAARRRGLRPLRRRAGRRGSQEPRPAARVPRRGPHPHRRGGRRPARHDRGRAGEDRRVAA